MKKALLVTHFWHKNTLVKAYWHKNFILFFQYFRTSHFPSPLPCLWCSDILQIKTHGEMCFSNLILIISNEKTTDISGILDGSFYQHILLSFRV